METEWLYSFLFGRPGLKRRLEYRLSLSRYFVVFLSFFRQIHSRNLKSGHVPFVVHSLSINNPISRLCRSQYSRGLRRGAAAAHLQGSWVRIPPVAPTSASFECFVLSGRVLCVRLITRPEKSYRV
jgi:hypothetical protein